MATQNVTVPVAAATYDLLAEKLADLVGVIRQCLKDGWNPASDIPAIAMAAIKDFGSGIQELGEVASEAKGDSVQFAQAIALGGAAVVGKAIG